jgi:glycosyltransferase involved in cell wall biosynthesis
VKIAYLIGTSNGNVGGMERHVLELAAALSERHDVTLIADPAYADAIPDGVRFAPLNLSRSRRHPLLWFQLRRLLQRLKTDLIHAHGAKAASLVSSHRRRLKALNTAFIGTVHGTKSAHRTYRHCDGVIAVSEAIAAHTGHPRTQVIHNGIKPPVLRSEALETCRKTAETFHRPLALAIGRLVPVKGFDLLIEAWQKVSGGHLLILGEGPERAALQARISEFGLENQITLVGHSTAVAAWLSLADLAIISSRREGFPYVLVEALQMACPVVATDVSGVREVLEGEPLAEPGSVDSLRGVLIDSLQDPAGLRSRQSACFARAKREFTLDAMSAKTEAFYQQIRKTIS